MVIFKRHATAGMNKGKWKADAVKRVEIEIRVYGGLGR
jgi:hypothetical protein